MILAKKLNINPLKKCDSKFFQKNCTFNFLLQVLALFPPCVLFYK
jgi:hypothetical protein